MGEWIVSSCVLILLIMAIRQIFRKRLDLKIRYALWLLVAVRLLTPFPLAESRFSVLNLLDADRMFGSGAEKDTGDAVLPRGGNGAASGESSGMNGDISWAGSGENGDAQGMPYGEAGNALGTSGEKAGYAPGILYGEDGNTLGVRQGWAGNVLGMPYYEEDGNTLGMRQGEYGNAPGMGMEENEYKAMDSLETSQGKPSWGELFCRQQGKGRIWSGQFLGIVWLAGSLLCGTVIFTANLRDGRKRRHSRVPLAWEGESRLPVYVSEAVETPCLAGILHPAVYLTKEAAGQEEQRLSYIVAHENIHYMHKDHLWAVLRTICLCVHWFNPLVWKAVCLARQDGELACDADVLKHLRREERMEYGKALLDLGIQRDAAFGSVKLATTMSGGKSQLRERLEMIRRRPGRPTGVMAVVAVLVAVVLAVTFTGRREADGIPGVPREESRTSTDAGQIGNGVMGLPGKTLWEASGTKGFLPETSLYDPPLGGSLLSGADAGSIVGEPERESEEPPETGTMFGYSDYTGYLDQCVQWLGNENFKDCDYDGDGIVDRVWRENIQDWGLADYRIEFGCGDVIQLPKTGGGVPEVRTLDLEGDGVREILFTETFGYNTDPKAFGQMALFRKSGESYEMMELPGGMSRTDREEQIVDGTLPQYRPFLPIYYEAAGEYLMRVTCPESENVEGLKPLDVTVDFTQEQWEMGRYDELYATDFSGSGGPYQVDILSGENGRNSLRLYYGVLDKWCDDHVAVTLAWQEEELRIRDIQYWHNYIETAQAKIGGQQYELILSGTGYVGEGRYTIDSILVDRFYYDERFGGMVEDHVQLIDPGDAARQYWGLGAASQGGVMASPVSPDRAGNLLVADLDFDGNEDFCIQGWIPGRGNIPYYCYFWNEDKGQFVYGGCLTNVEPDEDSKCIRSTVHMEGGYDITYYRYEDGALVPERYRKEDLSSHAVFGHLDLAYVETDYSMDKADYVNDAPHIFRLAEQALTELYQMTGTKVEQACFTATEFGDFYFTLSEDELKAGMSYYDRCYGAQEGFEECITSICITDGQEGYWLDASPVEYLVRPPDQDAMTDTEMVQWYFENSPLAQIKQRQLGSTVLKTGDTVASIEETFEGNYIIRTKSGKYYELTYNKDTRRVHTYYGPYDSFPAH